MFLLSRKDRPVKSSACSTPTGLGPHKVESGLPLRPHVGQRHSGIRRTVIFDGAVLLFESLRFLPCTEQALHVMR